MMIIIIIIIIIIMILFRFQVKYLAANGLLTGETIFTTLRWTETFHMTDRQTHTHIHTHTHTHT